MTLKLVGIFTLVKLIQLSKQFIPIELMLLERFIDSKEVHP